MAELEGYLTHLLLTVNEYFLLLKYRLTLQHPEAPKNLNLCTSRTTISQHNARINSYFSLCLNRNGRR